jgi:8-oxo-dGTP diphosphatase
MAYTYEYPRPALTVDCVIFGLDADGRDLRVLLIERDGEPFAGHWALPGGFVDMGEDTETAARRELEEETGVKDVFVEQLYTFSAPNRDPRGRVISVAYFALVNLKNHHAVAASDARRAEWHKAFDLPHDLAFDHAEILKMAVQRLQSKVRWQPIGFELLPKHFSLSQLQDMYEKILNRPLNKRNFRSKILKMGVLELVERQKDVAHRPAYLYQFNQEKYEILSKMGFMFEI